MSESTISLLRSCESSARTIGTSFLGRDPMSERASILRPVLGLMSETIFSKSRIMISWFSNLIIPVEILSSAFEIVALGLMMSAHDTLWIPTTESTWKAISSLLKLVTMKSPPGFDAPLWRQFLRSIAVIIVSRGINMPSILGWALGTGVTSWYTIISLILATLIP